MIDVASVGVENDANHVESRFQSQSLMLKVMPCSYCEESLFLMVDGIFRTHEGVVGASFYLNEHYLVFMLCDDIYLQIAIFPVALKNLVTFLAQQIGSELFAFVSE